MPEPRKDTPLPGEEAAISAIADILARKVRATYRPGVVVRRDAHPKHHACVEAHVTVHEAIAADLRHGVFAAPRTYGAWIRFSNGAPAIQRDNRRDARGMAIKLVGVRAPGAPASDPPLTQDFVLSSDRGFFVRNAIDYVAFARAAADPDIPAVTRAACLLAFYFGGLPTEWRLRELQRVLRCLIRIDNPLGIRYYSQTPYRLGPHAVKYAARPLGPAAAPASRSTPDFLQDVMAAQLERGEAAFELLVQRWVDDERTPIEDPTADWDETVTPFEPVARIRIPSQTVKDPVKLALAENLSFTPWHALPDHLPLGSINRVRQRVYDTVSTIRHELNGVPRQEPVSLNASEGQS